MGPKPPWNVWPYRSAELVGLLHRIGNPHVATLRATHFLSALWTRLSATYAPEVVVPIRSASAFPERRPS